MFLCLLSSSLLSSVCVLHSFLISNFLCFICSSIFVTFASQFPSLILFSLPFLLLSHSGISYLLFSFPSFLECFNSILLLSFLFSLVNYQLMSFLCSFCRYFQSNSTLFIYKQFERQFISDVISKHLILSSYFLPFLHFISLISCVLPGSLPFFFHILKTPIILNLY